MSISLETRMDGHTTDKPASKEAGSDQNETKNLILDASSYEEGQDSGGEEVFSLGLPPECDLSLILAERRRRRRKKAVASALEGSHALSRTSQDNLLRIHLVGGWSRFSHGLLRHFRSPARYGHKLVDIAVILTIHDRTISSVKPIMFAAITAKEFQEETGMDESNIRKALKGLVERGALLRIEGGSNVIFWGINPYFFAAPEKGEPPSGGSPRGKSPGSSAPSSKQGESPRATSGQITYGQSFQGSGNQNEISAPKNLLKESKKESLFFAADYPQDICARWTRFQEKGLDSKVARERVIFDKLFLEHRETFFHFCGRVIEFLEKRGTRKAGQGNQIYCPMSWLQGHWETNLTPYRNWKTEQETLEQAHAIRLSQEAKERAVEAEKNRFKAIEDEKDAEWREQQESAALRFLSQYSTEDQVRAFAEEAIGILGCGFTRSAWERGGWGHPLARSCILDHFMKVERGERLTGVGSSVGEVVA